MLFLLGIILAYLNTSLGSAFTPSMRFVTNFENEETDMFEMFKSALLQNLSE